LNEGSGPIASDSSGNANDGSIVGAVWTTGFSFNKAPDQPILNAPPNGTSGVSSSPTLEVFVSDPDSDNLTVTFYGREVPASENEFTIVALPDTQFYSESFPEIFDAQTQWIIQNQNTLNIIFVTHLGDIVQNGALDLIEWQNASNSMSTLDGIVPYGLVVGNHDMDIVDDPDGVAIMFNQFFPVSKFEHESWWGGNFLENKNSYQLFSVGTLDFIILHLEADAPDEVLSWAGEVLGTYFDRRAIVSTHIYLDPETGQRAVPPESPFFRTNGNSGEDIWNKLVKKHCNIFMVLSGHLSGESLQSTTNDCGNTVFEIVQNYQDLANGGNGWLRYYTLRPSENRIYAFTYSPTLALFETDSNSEFIIDYDLAGNDFTILGTYPDVPSISTVTHIWSDRSQGTKYEWYITVSDENNTTTGPIWDFTVE
jgi:hypothetical protein